MLKEFTPLVQATNDVRSGVNRCFCCRRSLRLFLSVYLSFYFSAGDECALNCRAIGMDFYATLNRTVADGTPCSKPHTSHGRRAPSGTRGICIGGYCKVSSEVL